MAALPYREAGAFMTDLRDQEGIASLAFQFLILNTARTVEVIGARVGEIDKAARLRVIPPARSKNGKEQRRPLADTSIAILDQIDAIREPECSYLFPGQDGRGAMSPSAFLNVLKRMKRRKQITPHGMKSTFKDWAIEQTSFPESASQLALGDDVGKSWNAHIGGAICWRSGARSQRHGPTIATKSRPTRLCLWIK